MLISQQSNSEIKATFLAHLKETGRVLHSAAAADIDRVTAYRWRKTDPEFAQAWDDCIEDSIEVLEESAYQRAMKGDTTLTIFLLKAARPNTYRDQLRITVDDMDSAINTAIAKHNLRLPETTDGE